MVVQESTRNWCNRPGKDLIDPEKSDGQAAAAPQWRLKIVTLSGKSSLILGENKAAFPREGHINIERYIINNELFFHEGKQD